MVFYREGLTSVAYRVHLDARKLALTYSPCIVMLSLGKTMLEKLVASYPRRIDLWSCYADQLVRK